MARDRHLADLAKFSPAPITRRDEHGDYTIVSLARDGAALTLYSDDTDGEVTLAIRSQFSRHCDGKHFVGVVRANDGAEIRLPGIGWNKVGGPKIGQETERFVRRAGA